LTQPERRDDVADGTFAGRQEDQDVAPAGFGDGIEDVRVVRGARHEEHCIPITEYVNSRRIPGRFAARYSRVAAP
jgi:hypothetical protein